MNPKKIKAKRKEELKQQEVIKNTILEIYPSHNIKFKYSTKKDKPDNI